MRSALLLLLAAPVLACAGDDASETTPDAAAIDVADVADVAEVAEPDPVVDPAGTYGVGFRNWEVTYTPKGLDAERPIRLSVWYPTLDTDGIPALYQGFLERPEVFVDAAPAELTGRPVLVFSHGNRSMAEQNFYLTEHLATRGWVVVAPYHTGNTFTDFAAPVTADTFVTRAQDLTAALDVILSLPTDDPLAALPSAELVVASGHSYGGYTTLAWTGGVHRTCDPPDGTLCDGMTDQKAQALTQVADARVKLAIPMAAGNYVDLPDVSPIDIPVMFMSGALDIAVPDAENGDKYWDSLDGEHDVRINLTTGAHQTFTIACTHLTSLEEGDGCEGDEFMDPGTAQQVITRYFEAFVSLHLFDDDPEAAAIVSGETSLHPDIIVTAKQ